jgi:uncharacterized membrane protein
VERHGSGHRRRLTIALLVLASMACVGLVALQVDTSWEYQTRFLIENLVLAWIPFLLALIVYDGYRHHAPRWLLLGVGALWLLFLPNAPYILTDFVHLRDPGAEVLWFDAAMIGAFALVGLVLGLGSLALVQAVVTDARGARAGWIVGLGALGLSSVGIYLGRFVEVNSWDAFLDPGRVLQPIVDQVRESILYPKFIGVTVALTLFLVLAYLLVHALAQPVVAIERRGAGRP